MPSKQRQTQSTTAEEWGKKTLHTTAIQISTHDESVAHGVVFVPSSPLAALACWQRLSKHHKNKQKERIPVGAGAATHSRRRHTCNVRQGWKDPPRLTPHASIALTENAVDTGAIPWRAKQPSQWSLCVVQRDNARFGGVYLGAWQVPTTRLQQHDRTCRRHERATPNTTQPPTTHSTHTVRRRTTAVCSTSPARHPKDIFDKGTTQCSHSLSAVSAAAEYRLAVGADGTRPLEGEVDRGDIGASSTNFSCIARDRGHAKTRQTSHTVSTCANPSAQ